MEQKVGRGSEILAASIFDTPIVVIEAQAKRAIFFAIGRMGQLRVKLSFLRELRCNLPSDRWIAQQDLASKCEMSVRTLELIFKNGRGDAEKLTRLLIALGVPRSEVQIHLEAVDAYRLKRPKSATYFLDSENIEFKRLETLMMTGHIAVVEKTIADRRLKNDEDVAALLTAELEKWRGDSDSAREIFGTLTDSGRASIGAYALSGLLRIARDQKDTKKIAELENRLRKCRRGIPAVIKYAISSTLKSLQALSPKIVGRKAISKAKLAIVLAKKSGVTTEYLKRLIELASIFRREHMKLANDDNLYRSLAAYIDAYVVADTTKNFVYMASALNGLARLSEHEATLAEISGDFALCKIKLEEADRILRQAVDWAAVSQHAGIRAIVIGCKAIVMRRLGDFGSAIALSKESLELEGKIGRRINEKIDAENIRLSEARLTCYTDRT